MPIEGAPGAFRPPRAGSRCSARALGSPPDLEIRQRTRHRCAVALLASAPEWIDTAISGASGVVGAFVGASAALWMHRRGMRAAEEAERKAALVGFYAAVNKLGLFFSTWAAIQPKGDVLKDARIGWRTFGFQGRLIERGWLVTDEFWAASGRVRAVASADELAVIDELENVIADWTFGKPMPDAWGAAIDNLRRLIESADLPAPLPKE